MDEQVLYPVDLIRPGFVLPPDAKMIAVQKGWIKIDDDFVNLDNVAHITTALNWHGSVTGAKCVIFFNDGKPLTVKGEDARKVAAMMEDIIEDTCAVQDVTIEQHESQLQGQLAVLTHAAMEDINRNRKVVERFREYLLTTRGIHFGIWPDFKVGATLNRASVQLSNHHDGTGSFEEFLDWAFAQPMLTEDDGAWFRPPAEDKSDG